MSRPNDEGLFDDPSLLRIMMAEQEAGDPIYHTTNYWKNYEKRLLPYLDAHGLKGFRSGVYARGGEVLHSFGASDAPLSRKMPLPVRVVEKLLRMAGFVGPATGLRHRFSQLDPTELSARQDQMIATVMACGRGDSAKPVHNLDISRVGAPGSAFDHQRNTLTPAALYYYMRYAYVSNWLNFESLTVVAELSSGSGKQAEVLAKLHPDLTLMLFDIPPQLYVAHQYLSAVFPERVVRFDPDAHRKPDFKVERGKIYLFGNWQIDLLRSMQVDLFWSAASLGEMEPDVAQHYLFLANDIARHVYLMQKMDGKEVATRRGSHGVLSKVTLEHYQTALSDFKMMNRAQARVPDGGLLGEGYEDSFWSRKT